MKRILVTLLLIFVLALFIGTGYFLYQKSQQPPVVYETDAPFKTDIVKKTIATGTILPRKEVALKSQVSGVVEKLYVEEGAIVKVGDPIAKIRIIPPVVALNNAQTQLQTARINLENATGERDRQKKLYDNKVISEMEYNAFLLDYKLRAQAVEAAENNLELVKEGSSKKSGTVSNVT